MSGAKKPLKIDIATETPRPRREFVKQTSMAVAATALSSLVLLSKPAAAQIESNRSSPNTEGKRFAMVIDMQRCIGCDACASACKAENNVPIGVFRTWVEKHEAGTFPNIKVVFAPKLCNQCANPPCVSVCPVEATFKRSDGLVLIDYDVCIGCGYCIQACPYGVRYIDPVRHVADKCTFCTQRVEQGLKPACVETCVGGARIFGDLKDADSTVRRLFDTEPLQVLKPDLGTKPHVFYVDLDSTVVR